MPLRAEAAVVELVNVFHSVSVYICMQACARIICTSVCEIYPSAHPSLVALGARMQLIGALEPEESSALIFAVYFVMRINLR